MTVEPVIHVGIEGSWRETGALEWALQESLLRREPLRAVHVIDQRIRQSPSWQPTQAEDAAIGLVTAVQQYLDEIPGEFDLETDLAVGPPAATLNELAEHAHMLVVGRRGMGQFKRLLIGSTSEAAATRASAPVVVVPDHWRPAQHAGPILVAVAGDFGKDRAAIDFAVGAALAHHVAVRMIHVWDLPAIYSWDAMTVAGVDEEWARSARRRASAFVEKWQAENPAVVLETEVRRGHPVDGIITAASDVDAQLLVVGGRRHAQVTTALLGSVARGVLHHATCPVAVVHAPPEPAEQPSVW
ncbi:nucleotide-binding universal stress UspA family protein [Kribbella amoyensis]|uniref:Nucleotide-binding universal stress UspA family protein n=1 Tax=Kribbella amoyensis TaxID=996641 RepID=A0A561C0Q0_9ACTN|nr:universal stress protein [Kribbella amoyensis]TWD84660.1 nucleotide-binding universal stress UspA family protein [Kribbella amoyensis]